MKKLKLYLDTSVVSHLDQEDAPEKMRDTRKFWETLKTGVWEAVVSDVVYDELSRCAEPKRTLLATYMDQIPYTHVCDSPDALQLAGRFIDFGILREKSRDDCRHIAHAILSDCDIIVSWNFKHIVNPHTMKGVKVITTAEGYKDLLICTPTMLVEGGVFDE
jgi:predicted nucleic acid-binding protein